jgi:hypothetical protein
MGDPKPATDTDPTPWREPFERALDADPSDQRVRRDLADHLDEVGDPDAEPVRWLAENGKWPDMQGQTPSWYRRQIHRSSSVLPENVFDRLLTDRRTWRTLESGGAYYPNRREAEADFCRAFQQAKASGWDPGDEP